MNLYFVNFVFFVLLVSKVLSVVYRYLFDLSMKIINKISQGPMIRVIIRLSTAPFSNVEQRRFANGRCGLIGRCCCCPLGPQRSIVNLKTLLRM